jgi:hypothetical protein
MLNNNDFISLERRLWREGNPLTDELTSTRDELTYLLSQAQKVLEKYSPALNAFVESSDIEYFLEWDNFTDAVDNLSYNLGDQQ